MYHYGPLRDFLSARGDRPVSLSFGEIEEIIGRPLPSSASGAVSRQWWANAPSHSQARAWLSGGRKAKLNLSTRSVTFSRLKSSTTLPDAIVVDTADLHPIALRLLETVVAESGITIEVATAALLNAAANDRQPRAE